MISSRPVWSLHWLNRGTRHLSVNPTLVLFKQDDSLLFEKSNQQLILVNKLALGLMEDVNEFSGILVLNVPVFLGHTFLSPWLAEFQKKHLKLHICLGTSNENINLLRDDVDLVIRFGPLVDSSLIARPIYTPEMVIVASVSYLNNHPIDTLAHLTEADWFKIHSQSPFC